MSYNIYKNSIHDIVTDQEVDRPILIGEFHFGTGSHGVWGSGLVLVCAWVWVGVHPEGRISPRVALRRASRGKGSPPGRASGAGPKSD